MYPITGKVIVITGASSGIGKALVFEALQRGALVAACARNEEKLNELYTNSAVNTEKLIVIKADVSREEDCRKLTEEVIKQHGRIDILINNAGISMRALFEDTDVAVLRELMDINFFGAVYCTKYALPHIMAQKGVIAGISSVAGYRGLPARTGYSASKFALQGFLEALRTELLYSGTHVMWISPGFTASNIRNVARSSNGSPQKETPLNENKLMTAEKCAEIILTALQKRKRTVLMTTIGKMTVWVNRILPWFVDRQAFKHFHAEPDSPLKKYKPN